MAGRRTQKKGLSVIDLLGSGFCILASLGLYMFVLAPLMAGRSVLTEQQKQISAQQERMATLEATITQLKNRSVETAQRLGQCSISLRPLTQVNRRVAELTQLMEDSQLVVDEIEIGEPQFGSQYSAILVGIAIKGQYLDCLAMLRELREGFPDVTLMRLQMAGRPGHVDAVVTFNLEFIWFAAPDRGVLEKRVSGSDPLPQFLLFGCTCS